MTSTFGVRRLDKKKIRGIKKKIWAGKKIE